MIPNIFVSSTIADLNYLRDGLRDAIEELCYHPVMSEHGEVGYLNPTTAAESCWRSVEQCQMVVLIVGKRYGSIGEDGVSVTHKEFLAAKENSIPVITFVDSKVLNYKEVYDTAPSEQMWAGFEPMDNPRKTFQLLEDVARAESFNAIIPFNSVGEAKKKLKLQIADFVGGRLSGAVPPIRSQLSDVLAEISTLRNVLMQSTEAFQAKQADAKHHLAAARFLLDEKAAVYRALLEQIFGDMDTAVAEAADKDCFANVLSAASYTHNIAPDPIPDKALIDSRDDATAPPEKRVMYAYYGARGAYAIYGNKHIKISQFQYGEFDKLQRALCAKAGNS